MTRLIKTAATVTGLFLFAGVAHAEQPFEVRAEVPRADIFYADLDIGSAAGLATLRSRVRSAASRMCLNGGTQPLGERTERRACYNGMVADAETQIARRLDRGTAFAGRRVIQVAARRR